jgi:ribosomal protein S20
MPITISAKKALRQNITRRVKNAAKKDSLKKTLKQYKKLVSQKNIDEAKNQLSAVYKALDKAAKTHIIKKAKAARLKSRLSRLVR